MRTITIRQDWQFYLIALAPYFLALFGVWIFLDEGFFAQRYNLPIIWALPLVFSGPEYRWPYLLYFLLGIAAVLGAMIFIWAVIVFVRREPPRGKPRPRGTFFGFIDWFRGGVRGKYPVSALFVSGISLLVAGLHLACQAFNLLQGTNFDQAFLSHQWSDICIILAFAMAFVVVVCERGEE